MFTIQKIASYGVIFTFALVSNLTLADKRPLPTAADGRVKVVAYDPHDVVTITAHYGFSSLLQLSEAEEILTVSLGDTIAWTFLEVRNLLFIKPILPNADTNMQIVTNKRIYNFALDAQKATSHADKNLTFTLKFKYPIEENRLAQLEHIRKEKEAEENHPSLVVPDSSFKAEDVNMEYTYKGDDSIAPQRVFDNGQFTYFLFDENAPNPAIFAVDSQQKESVVNFHRSGKYIVVQRLARQFTLRHGSEIACVFNKSFLPDSVKSDLEHESDYKDTSHKMSKSSTLNKGGSHDDS
jgi:type IV secretion system protein VirB9